MSLSIPPTIRFTSKLNQPNQKSTLSSSTSTLNFRGLPEKSVFLDKGKHIPFNYFNKISFGNNTPLRSDKHLSSELKQIINKEAEKRITQTPKWNIENPNIWMVTAETSTFMKTGGLGDVAVDLPNEFNNAFNKYGAKMTIVQPLYESGDLVKLEQTGENTYKYTSKTMGNTIDLVDTGVKLEIPTDKKGEVTVVTVLEGILKDTNTKYKFLRNDKYFGKIPNDGKKVTPYVPNNNGVGESERFAFFSKSVANYVKELKKNNPEEAPNVIDANDWHAGPLTAQFRYLIPAKAQDGTKEDKKIADELKNIPIVYTVHNLEYQGWDYENTNKIMNLLYEGYSKGIFDNAKVPLMEETSNNHAPKAIRVRDTYNAAMHGLALSDVVTLVSPNYSNEVATDKFFGYDFVNLLSARKDSLNLTGIINGISQEGIVPDGKVTDKLNNAMKTHINYDILTKYNKSYSADEIKKIRAKNKENFIKLLQSNVIQCALNTNSTDGSNFSTLKINDIEKTPLLTIVGRLADQKGTDIMADAIKHVLTKPIPKGQERPIVVVQGSGNAASEFIKLKKELPKELSDRVVFINEFVSDVVVHLIQMAGDMFLMPSKFEPCGLTQMQVMAKGNVPIATATGGLADTIEDGKTGYLSKYDPNNLEDTKKNYRETLDKALNTYYNDRNTFDSISIAAINKDFSWEGSGSLDKYLELFKHGITE